MKWLAASICILILSSCATDLEKIKKITENDDDYLEKGFDIEMLYSEKGNLKAKIIAPELSRYQLKDSYTQFDKGLKMFFYNPKVEIESKLSANFGVIYHDKDEMMVRDDVVFINVKGEKLNTEELIWKKKDRQVYSDKFVKITTPEEIIYGNGFQANEDFSDYVIKNISGVISVEEDATKQPY